MNVIFQKEMLVTVPAFVPFATALVSFVGIEATHRPVDVIMWKVISQPDVMFSFLFLGYLAAVGGFATRELFVAFSSKNK
jgi:hypothetical protein